MLQSRGSLAVLLVVAVGGGGGTGGLAVAAPSHWASSQGADSMCDGSIDSPLRFRLPARWGASEPDPQEAPAASCGHDGTSRRLIPGPVAVEGDAEVLVATVEEQHARRGNRRRLEVSFLVPSGTLPTFNHVAALVAFDPSDSRYRRSGSAVFEDRLYVEVEDPGCGLDSNLRAGVEIPGGLESDRWYRLVAELEPDGLGVVLRATLLDLETRSVVATTTDRPPCAMRWAARACTAVGFLATVPTATGGDPGGVLIDDYYAKAESVRAGLRGPVSLR